MPLKATYYAAKFRPRVPIVARSPLLTVALATLREAWRGRLLALWLLLLASVAGLAVFVSQLALTEGERFRLVWLAVGARLAAVLIVALFLAGSVIRERDDRRIEFVLATAISRWQYVFGKWSGVVLLALAIALSAGVAVSLAGGASVNWGLSLWLELALVAALTLFAASTLGSIAPALAFVLGSYFLARMWPGLVYLSQASVFLNENSVLSGAAQIFAIVLPRLDLFTRTDWVFQPDRQALLIAALHGLIYIALLLTATLIDSRRREP